MKNSDDLSRENAYVCILFKDTKIRLGGLAGPKIQARPGLRGARTKSAGLMPGSWKEITLYYALDAGLRAVLERHWPRSIMGSAYFVRCQSGLGLDFWRSFCTSNAPLML